MIEVCKATSNPNRLTKPSRNVSTTSLRQWGFWQCLPFSWTTLRGKHCWHPIAVMGVVDTFEPRFVNNYENGKSN
jgi:hypothetical protein